MVTIDQAMRGILRFFDTVASPHMDEVRSFVAGVGLSLLADGSKAEGTIANNGAISKTIDGLTQTSVDIPAGYTSGGTVSLTDDIENALAAI